MSQIKAKSDTSSTRRFDSAEQEAYLAMWRTYDRLQALEEDLFKPWGVTAQQYNLLRLLKASYPEAVPTLSVVKRLISRAPGVTRMLDRLEAAGWITRARSEADRRAVLIAISDAGLQLLDDMAELLRDCHEKQLGHLTAGELKSLTALLKAARAPHEPDDSPWN